MTAARHANLRDRRPLTQTHRQSRRNLRRITARMSPPDFRPGTVLLVCAHIPQKPMRDQTHPVPEKPVTRNDDIIAVMGHRLTRNPDQSAVQPPSTEIVVPVI